MTKAGAPEIDTPVAASGARSPRVDALFIIVIAVVSMMVLALMAAFSMQNGLHARTLETIGVSRNVRDETLSIAQALADVEAARRAIVLGRQSASADTEAAKTDARAHVEALLGHAGVDPDLAQAAARVRDLIEQDFALDGANGRSSRILAQSDTLRADLRVATDALLTGVSAYNDVARAAERDTREVLDAIAIALGLLALAASALAVLALRRERENWRLAQAETEAARARATASDLAKSRFLAAASHDMRQPLHALTLYLSALDRRVENPEARDILAKMERATQSMVGMFATLLDLARIQAGIIHPDIADVPLQEIINRVIAENPGGRLASPPTALGVCTDAVLLERVLRNLVANALKHGGGAARIECASNDDRVEIAVIDDGPGISEADQARIFEEFVRLEGRTGGDGLGLGLAIVKRICDLLSLPLTLRSAPGQGARFTVSAPRAALAAAPSAAVVQHDVALRGVRVLVVDDDALAREAIAGALRDLGAEVRAAESEADAGQVLSEGFIPRLIVMDLRHDNELRGIAVADALCARVKPAPRAIIVTGDTGPDALEALRASNYAWLIKPVDPRELSQAAAAELDAA